MATPDVDVEDMTADQLDALEDRRVEKEHRVDEYEERAVAAKKEALRLATEELANEEGAVKSAMDELVVPVEFLNDMSNQEIDEIKEMFIEVDADNSGYIDENELATAFEGLDEELSREQIRELMNEVDADNSGEIDFGEFMSMIVSLRRGETRFKGFAKLLQSFFVTPVSVLEQQAKSRGLSVAYKVVEIRPATAVLPAAFVMAALITGEWVEYVGGKINKVNETREFEGIGKSTRDARFKAASNALERLREYVPGLNYEEGVVPPEWMAWVEKNLDRGVDANALLSILVAKGFKPAKSKELMHLVNAHSSIDRATGSISARTHEQSIVTSVDLRARLERVMKAAEEGTAPAPRVPLELYDPVGRPDTPGTPISSGLMPDTSSKLIAYEKPLPGKPLPGSRPAELAGVGTPARLQARGMKYAKQGPQPGVPVGADGKPLMTAAEAAVVSLGELHTQREITPEWAEWVRNNLQRGVAGEVILDILMKHGFNAHLNPAFVQALTSGKTGRQPPPEARAARKRMALRAERLAMKEKEQADVAMLSLALGGAGKTETDRGKVKRHGDDNYRRSFEMTNAERAAQRSDDVGDFWSAVERGDLADVKRYHSGGQDLNERRRGVPPIVTAAKHMRIDIITYFLFHNADREAADTMGRTALHIAAGSGHQQVVMMLASNGCFLYSRDKYGATPLHHAAAAGKHKVVKWLLSYAEERLRRYLHSQGVVEKTEQLYRDVLKKKLTPYQQQLFDPVWIAEAGQMFYESLPHPLRMFMPPPTRLIGDITRRRYMRDPTGGANKHMYEAEFMFMFPRMLLDNLSSPRNTVGRVPLHNAVDPPMTKVTDDHVETAWALLQVFGADTEMIDTFNLTPLAAVLQRDPHLETTFGYALDLWPRGLEKQLASKQEAAGTLVEPGTYEEIVDVEEGPKMATKAEERKAKAAADKVKTAGIVGLGDDTATAAEGGAAAGAGSGGGGDDSGEPLYDENGMEIKKMWVPKKRGPKVINKTGGFKSAALANRVGGGATAGARQKRSEDKGASKDWLAEKAHQKKMARKAEKRAARARGEDVSDDSEDEAERKLKRALERAHVRPGSPKTKLNTERVADMLRNSAHRLKAEYLMCEWGCRTWMFKKDRRQHEENECVRRTSLCPLGCGLLLRFEQWEVFKTVHLEDECPRRLLPCPQLCGLDIMAEAMRRHKEEECIRRKVPPRPCKLGCGEIFEGGNDRLKEMEEEMEEHYKESCPRRMVKCDFDGCGSQMEARHRGKHRKKHLREMGMRKFYTAGEWELKIPGHIREVKVQLWGGGGGGGQLLGLRGCPGGGGGYVETIIEVFGKEKLTIIVGEGGEGGVFGETGNPANAILKKPAQPPKIGIAKGGVPGGGEGHGGNTSWAAGGGGGFSAIYREGPFGKELIAMAGGGGGGGTRRGGPGGHMGVRTWGDGPEDRDTVGGDHPKDEVADEEDYLKETDGAKEAGNMLRPDGEWDESDDDGMGPQGARSEGVTEMLDGLDGRTFNPYADSSSSESETESSDDDGDYDYVSDDSLTKSRKTGVASKVSRPTPSKGGGKSTRSKRSKGTTKLSRALTVKSSNKSRGSRGSRASKASVSSKAGAPARDFGLAGGELTADGDDLLRCGRAAGHSAPGKGGFGGAQNGGSQQGGNGAKFGGGGGGGLFGGGGGGNTPGLVGGGGGGSSWVMSRPEYRPVIIGGDGRLPGGMDRDPPPAVGIGEWDTKGGPAGMGGMGNAVMHETGRAGAVVVRMPGYYDPDATQDKEMRAWVLQTMDIGVRRPSISSEVSKDERPPALTDAGAAAGAGADSAPGSARSAASSGFSGSARGSRRQSAARAALERASAAGDGSASIGGVSGNAGISARGSAPSTVA